MLKDSAAPSAHDAIIGMHGRHLATIRSGRWKPLFHNPGPPMFSNLSEEEKAHWIDPRGADGVHLLAPPDTILRRHRTLVARSNARCLQMIGSDATKTC